MKIIIIEQSNFNIINKIMTSICCIEYSFKNNIDIKKKIINIYNNNTNLNKNNINYI